LPLPPPAAALSLTGAASPLSRVLTLNAVRSELGKLKSQLEEAAKAKQTHAHVLLEVRRCLPAGHPCVCSPAGPRPALRRRKRPLRRCVQRRRSGGSLACGWLMRVMQELNALKAEAKRLTAEGRQVRGRSAAARRSAGGLTAGARGQTWEGKQKLFEENVSLNQTLLDTVGHRAPPPPPPPLLRPLTYAACRPRMQRAELKQKEEQLVGTDRPAARIGCAVDLTTRARLLCRTWRGATCSWPSRRSTSCAR
jgi:hypothetical protein